MGRRSRKRLAADAPAGARAEEARRGPSEPAGSSAGPAGAPRRRARVSEAPPAPWSPFPLVELCILAGIVLLVVGLVVHGRRGPVLAGCGLALIALSALELSIREHFSGYRSHSALLAGAATVAAEALLYFTLHPLPLLLAPIAAAVFGGMWVLLRSAFRRRTGMGWRA
ncbi:MAG: hypothetical protein E6G56_11085 [Actinobacteria bacterium]|nr:MAG: hypothetical protein E6G56_11085 [Actinomycetota bacterium]